MNAAVIPEKAAILSQKVVKVTWRHGSGGGRCRDGMGANSAN